MTPTAPLTVLIDQAQQALDRTMEALGHALQRRDALDHAEQGARRCIDQAREGIIAQLTVGTSGSAVRNQHLYEQGLHETIARCQTQRDAAEQAVKTAQDAYLNARQVVNGYRTVEQRRAARAAQAGQRQEQRDQDDLGQRARPGFARR